MSKPNTVTENCEFCGMPLPEYTARAGSRYSIQMAAVSPTGLLIGS